MEQRHNLRIVYMSCAKERRYLGNESRYDVVADGHELTTAEWLNIERLRLPAASQEEMQLARSRLVQHSENCYFT